MTSIRWVGNVNWRSQPAVAPALRVPALEDLERLRFTGQVFREALRLYPPAWIIGRQALTDYKLGTVNVPARAILFLSPFSTYRDPRFRNNPEAFEPERWADDSSSIARPKFAYFPFGAGTRVCIGEHFAMMEGVLALATIAQRWRLHPIPAQKVEAWPQITLRPQSNPCGSGLICVRQPHASEPGAGIIERLSPTMSFKCCATVRISDALYNLDF